VILDGRGTIDTLFFFSGSAVGFSGADTNWVKSRFARSASALKV